MNDFQTVTSIPTTFNMINPVKSKNVTEDKTCLASFDYFNNGLLKETCLLGFIEKPMDEVLASF